MSKFTGIKKIEVQNAGGGWSSVTDLGVPLASSPSLAPEVAEVENAKGQMLYCGVKESSEWHIPSFTNFSALETRMENDTETDVRITFMDDTTEVIHSAALVKVFKPYGATVGSRNYMTVKFQTYRIT